MQLYTKAHVIEQIAALTLDVKAPLYDSSAPIDSTRPVIEGTRATIDDAVRAAAAKGWHVKQIIGYDPLKGGVPVYTWVFVSGNGKTEASGTGWPLRLACFRALEGVLV